MEGELINSPPASHWNIFRSCQYLFLGMLKYDGMLEIMPMRSVNNWKLFPC